MRFRVSPDRVEGRGDGGPTDDLLPRARPALEALAACPGYLAGWLARSTDDPSVWLLVTRWGTVGDYRRALSSWDVKLRAHPVLYEAVDEPTAFEELLEVRPDGTAVETPSDRAEDTRVGGQSADDAGRAPAPDR